LKAEPVVVSVFKSVDTIRERELKKALSMLKKSNPDDAKVIEQLSYAIVEGILSTPMNYLRKELEASGKDSEELMKLVAKMFRYEDEKKQ
jgi:glutamyl-tRNA reductase